MFYLQIVKGEEYAENHELQIQKTREVEGTRGNIYDRNGKLLAYNELAYSVMIEDNGEYDSTEEKNKELNKVISTVIDMVESNGDSIINDFGVILDQNDNYMFIAESDTQRLRFIADVYGQATIDKLTDEQKGQSAQEIIDYLCTDERYGYGIDQKELTKAEVLKLVNVRYAISLNSYREIHSHHHCRGCKRRDNGGCFRKSGYASGGQYRRAVSAPLCDSKYFANIIGYTGQISTEEYNSLSEEDKENYDQTDTVGKSGLEQTLDSTLKGKKGEVKLYVNNVGKVIETVQETEPRSRK